jgi:hypothetical protein
LPVICEASLLVTAELRRMSAPRSLKELTDPDRSGWRLVEEWVASSARTIRVLKREPARAASCLSHLQITTRSPLRAVAFETAGIVIDDGWIRVLGSGSSELNGDLQNWNDRAGVLIVAHDAIGGVFALDGGALGAGDGAAHYFAPEALRWQPLGRGYGDLLRFLLEGDLNDFYGSLRWTGWQTVTKGLNPDDGLMHMPPLWTVEGKDPERVSRRPIAMKELFDAELAFARQLDSDSAGE